MTYQVEMTPADPEARRSGLRRINISVEDSISEVFLGTLFVPDAIAQEVYDDLKERLK